MKHYPDVDAYLRESEQWPEEITALRPILLNTGLTEAIKWGKPCYSNEGKNIAIVQEMKEFLALMFFKGALLEDPADVLFDQGPNSRSARRMQFTSVEEITELQHSIRAYLPGAIEIEEAGLSVEAAPALELVEELREALDRDPELRAAFEALTPGRQREYNLHIAGAKQSKTRSTRVEKHADKIRAGKGLRDR